MLHRLALVALLVLASACPKSEPEGPPAVPPNERVRNAELPFSRRAGDSLSASAKVVVVAYDGIAVDGHDVVPLTRGALTPAPTKPEPIPALAAALSGGGDVRIRLHTAAKHATLLSVIATLRSKGFTRIGFDVRKDSLGEQTGTLVPASLEVRERSNDAHAFAAPIGRTWEQLVELWDDAFVACGESDGSFDCSAVTDKVAFGGDGEIQIFRRQNGVILSLRRFGTGGDIAEGEAFMQQQNDRRSGMRDRDADRAAAPPAVLASFGYRWQSLAAEPDSPLAKVMRQAVLAGPVGLRITLDENSDAGALVTVIGSAFPEGLEPPHVMTDASRL